MISPFSPPATAPVPLPQAPVLEIWDAAGHPSQQRLRSYPASKTTVDMLTIPYAKAFPAMRITAVEPGFTKTDLNGNTGVQTVEQGAEVIVRMAQLGPDGPTGTYVDAEGALPW